MEIGFSREQGWTNTNTTTTSETITDSYSGKVPAHSLRLIELVAMRTQSDIAYKATVSIEFAVTYLGFLRWGGNARVDHPTDRPFLATTFGATDGSKGAAEDIMDKYNHQGIPGYSIWDWTWMHKNFPDQVDRVVNTIGNNFVTAEIPGKFTDVKGIRCEIQAHQPELLPPAETIGSQIPNAAEHEHLKSDETPGVRVLF